MLNALEREWISTPTSLAPGTERNDIGFGTEHERRVGRVVDNNDLVLFRKTYDFFKKAFVAPAPVGLFG